MAKETKPAWKKYLEKMQRHDRAEKKRLQRQVRQDKQVGCRLNDRERK